MLTKRTNAEGIIHKLREADVLLGQGQDVNGVCKQLGVSEQTYDRWRKAYCESRRQDGHWNRSDRLTVAE